jgi:CBS domain containing-hemolysin-like protein
MLDLNLTIAGLILSIIFSGSEIALISANSLQINVWLKQKMRLSKWAVVILENKEEYLAIILIGTNFANILTTSFATIYLLRLEVISPQMIVIPIAIVILLFGEILPKTIIREYANIGIVILSPILIISRLLMFPILFIIKKFGFMHVTETQSSADELEEKRDDLQHVYEQVNDKETIEKDQQELITNVFEISEITVHEAMTPRTDISAVSKNDSLEKLLHIFIDSGHSKLPVYDKNIDNIVGVIYLYDLFNSPENLKDVIKPVHFTPYSKLLMDLMSEFQNSRHALAIVLDEHGGTAGLITAEDVFEELFGDFEDEFDSDTAEGVTHDDGSISVDAKMDCETYNNRFTDIFPEGEYETLGGFIISETGRIPNQGERLFTSIGQIEIIKASARLIVQIRIYPENPA